MRRASSSGLVHAECAGLELGLGMSDLALCAGACSQLGPDAMPVIWAKVAASYCSAGGGFNRPAVGRTRFALGVPVLPLPDLRIAAGPDLQTKVRDAQGIWPCQVFR